MKKITQILIILSLLILVGAGISAPIKTARAASCYSPFQRIDTEEVYNGSVCRGNFQVYYFPVVTDGRQYTITLRTVSGRQKLYASRYKDDVAKLSNVVNWRCYGPHCDSSTEADAETRFVTFYSPAGDPDYYSWFAVYGTTDSQYQIGLSNNGVTQFIRGANYISAPTYQPQPTWPAGVSGAASIIWKTLSPESAAYFGDTSWTAAGYSDNGWQNISLPDSGWNCNNCYRRYRGTFYLDNLSQTIRASFESDDGVWIYINGQYLGHWGGAAGGLRCVNHFGCELNDKADDIALTNLVQGKNVISAIVSDGGGGEFFDLKLK